MAEKHLDHPGEVSWTKPGRGPAVVVGPCPHVGCSHTEQAVIAWGPDDRHYELIECVGVCRGECRAWTDGAEWTTSEWLQVSD